MSHLNESELESRQKASSPEILVIGNAPESLRQLSEMLAQNGYRVRQSQSGNGGLSAAADSPPGLILLDVRMSGVDGFEVCRRLKEHPRLREIPVIFVSALDEIPDKVRGFQAGAVDYIVKPYQMEEVLARVRTHLELRRLQLELLCANDKIQAANKELEAFSYSVSHDLRAPLRAIDGFSQAILEDYADKLDPRGQKQLAFIRRGAQQMAALIDDMLRLSRVGRMEIRLEQANLSMIATSVASELQREQPNRRVDWQIDPGLCAFGDSSMLRILLNNLLANAWKFTSQREVARIEVGELHQKKGGEPEPERVFFIRDNGAGFNSKYVDKLFTPFQRLHSAEEFPGTGIGLAIAKPIVTRHGGRIWAEGAVNQGATLYFTLPQQRSES